MHSLKIFSNLTLLVLTLFLPLPSIQTSLLTDYSQNQQNGTLTNGPDACAVGCLRCDLGSRTCEICDSYSGFALVDGACHKSDLDHCLVSKSFGVCDLCQPKFYFDLSTFLCQPVPSLIPHCSFYVNEHQCLQCDNGFQKSPENGECLQISHPIDHCLFYDLGAPLLDNDPENPFFPCLQCESAFALDLDGKKCLPIPMSSCLSNFNTKCVEFQPNYAYKYSYLNFQQLGVENSWLPRYLDWVYSPIADLEESRNYLNQFPFVARTQETFNCRRLIDLHSCSQCTDQFSLNLFNLQCVFEPIVQVRNCLVFDSIKEECAECTQGFRIYQGQCVLDVLIDNCREFDTRLMRCSACSTSFFYSSANERCLPTPDIALCLSYDPEYTRCLQCEQYFEFDETSGKCLFDIDSGPVPNHCLLVDRESGKCTRCVDGFQLSDSTPNTCIPSGSAVQNCETFASGNHQICEKCKSGFILSSGKDFCKEERDPILHCQEMSNDTETCTKCLSGFTLSSDKKFCIFSSDAVEHCLHVNVVEHKCVTCIEGYLPSQDGKVCQYQKPVNCKTVATDSSTNLTKCSECDPHFKLESSLDRCFPEIKYCEQMEFENQILECRQCESGFFYDTIPNICWPEIAFCKEHVLTQLDPNYDMPENQQFEQESFFDGENYRTQCSCCQPGFVKSASARACLPEIGHCLQNEIVVDGQNREALVCKVCEAGFVLNDTGAKCLEEIPHCQNHWTLTSIQVNQAGQEERVFSIKCQKCEPGFTKSVDELHCYFIINGCKQYSGITDLVVVQDIRFLNCFECHSGLVLSSNSLNCLVPVPFCLTHTFSDVPEHLISQDVKCSNCADGFHASSDHSECIRSIPYCSSYVDSHPHTFGYLQKCQTCQSGFLLSTDSLKCLPEIPFCETYSSPTHLFDEHASCVECKENYKLSSDFAKCQRLVNFCISYDDSASSLNQPNLTCLACRSPYSLDTQSNTCQLNTCTEYDAVDPAKCVTCHFGFELVEASCEPIIPFCASFRPTQALGQIDHLKMICNECQFGFNLSPNQTKCISPDNNCKSFSRNASNDLECDTCHSGFTKSSLGKCEQSIPNCSDPNPETQECLACNPGFELSADKLQCRARNCDAHASDGTCQTCSNQNNLFLFELDQSGECVPKNANCASFNDGSGSESSSCQECKPGFSGNDCEIPAITNCSSFQDASTCADCVSGYYLQDNKCYIENCNFTALTFCYSCLSGFTWNNTLKTCEGGISNCQTRDPSNAQICSECEAGFDLVTDTSGKTSCSPSVSGCVRFSQGDSATCLECDAGFYLNRTMNICLDLIPNCESKDVPNETCTKCLKGYRLEDQCTKMNTDGCTQMLYGLYCQKCAIGYYYNAMTYSCEENVFECRAYSSEQVCSGCKPGSVLRSDGKCESLHCKNFAYDSPCGSCTPEFTTTKGKYEYCIECQDGFTLDGDHICKSEACSTHVLNRFTHSLECTQCDVEPARIFDNQYSCLEHEATCLEVDIHGKCTRCQGGLKLFDHLCFDSEDTLSGCSVDHELFDASSASEVLKCYRPEIGKYFDFQEDRIEDFVPFCLTYSNQEYCNKGCKCQTCLTGFTLFKDNLGQTMCHDQNLVVQVNDHSETLNPVFAPIQFKVTANQNAQNGSNTKTPETCHWDFFFSEPTQTCIEREVLDSACVQYFPNKDGCEVCKDEFFQTVDHRCGKIPDYQTEHCVQYAYGIRDHENQIVLSQFNAISVFPFSFGARTVTQRIIYDKGVERGDQHFCVVCDSDFYLNADHECEFMTPSSLIEGCFSYGPDFECIRCQEGFFLQIFEDDSSGRRSQCTASDHLQDCLISYDEFKCTKCKPGFDIQVKSVADVSLFQCVRVETSNCLHYQTHEGHLFCTKCKKGFFPEDQYLSMKDLITSQSFPEIGLTNAQKFQSEQEEVSRLTFTSESLRGMTRNKPFINTYFNNYFKFSYRKVTTCTEVAQKIENCESYETKDTCRFCYSGWILSADRRVCTQETLQRTDAHLTNQKCVRQQENRGGCNICSPGFYFDTQSDSCTECLSENCLLCREASPETCEICKSGYFMDSHGLCLLNPSVLKDLGYGDDFVQELQVIDGVYLVPNFDDFGNILCHAQRLFGLIFFALSMAIFFLK